MNAICLSSSCLLLTVQIHGSCPSRVARLSPERIWLRETSSDWSLQSYIHCIRLRPRLNGDEVFSVLKGWWDTLPVKILMLSLRYSFKPVTQAIPFAERQGLATVSFHHGRILSWPIRFTVFMEIWLHHHLANCIPVGHGLYMQFTRPFPLLQKWVWLVKLVSTGPLPLLRKWVWLLILVLAGPKISIF